MTMAEIKASNKPFLIPSDIAEVLGCKPYAISVQVGQAGGQEGGRNCYERRSEQLCP